MSIDSDFSLSPTDFCGTTRLFPLPNLVLFPHVMQPLHVFEPRYRDLLRDALAGDRLVTMAVLEPGWEKDYEGRPALFPIGCLGKIAAHHPLEDGSSNVLLYGLWRVRLVEELAPTKSYREARVQVCEDTSTAEDTATWPALQRRLRETFLRILPHLPQAREQWDHVLGSSISLGALTDIIGYVLDAELGPKKLLLAEVNVRRRAELLLEHLAAVGSLATATARPDSLPHFSEN